MSTVEQNSTAPASFEAARRSGARAWLRDNGLALVTFALFLVFIVGQTITGFYDHNDELMQHGEPQVTLRAYVVSGHFFEATAENWESEFLQMAMYVILTAFLYQRGSAESKAIGKREAVDRDPRLARNDPDAPWPVRRGGWVLKIYENSLSLAFLLLFLVSFALHAMGGTAAHNASRAVHGEDPLSLGQYLVTSQFWFESFQNWQSEFLSLVTMVVLSVFLRQRGSPESKPVDAPHHQTGSE